MQFHLRYDLRNPPQWRVPFERFYATFLEQAEWADAHGFASLGLSEHHFVDDGYLPSPFAVGGAVAARTKRLRIGFNVVLLPLKHPVQVAEDAAIVDIISAGRIDVGFGAGYRQTEFEAYGVPISDRAGLMDEGVEIIRRCWEEEEFSFDGKHWKLRNVRATPKPVQKPRPRIMMGGSSEAAARRAARLADSFVPTHPSFMAAYRDELRRLGKDPGPEPPADAPRTPMFLHVAHDTDAAWARIAPHALYETNEYARFLASDPSAPYQTATDAEQLRASGAYVVLTPEETVALGKRLEAALGPAAGLSFHPLMGGMPHELGQKSLELVAREVMPHFQDSEGHR
ncbi:MAG: LLM class flavin-dependent oxidoreductase [Chloroflexi bacterium]|nr:LLM class flavin-dependent oxidoreductase [Chloroflexota bacterium]